jgi:hypothetical protein
MLLLRPTPAPEPFDPSQYGLSDLDAGQFSHFCSKSLKSVNIRWSRTPAEQTSECVLLESKFVNFVGKPGSIHTFAPKHCGSISAHNSSSMIGACIPSVSVLWITEVNIAPRKLTDHQGFFELAFKW